MKGMISRASMAGLVGLLVGGCPQIAQVEQSRVLPGDWRDNKGRIIHFDEQGNFDYVLNSDGEKIFDADSRIVLGESIWGFYGYEDFAQSRFNWAGIESDLNRNLWEYDLVTRRDAKFEGFLVNKDLMNGSFYSKDYLFLEGFENKGIFQLVKIQNEK